MNNQSLVKSEIRRLFSKWNFFVFLFLLLFFTFIIYRGFGDYTYNLSQKKGFQENEQLVMKIYRRGDLIFPVEQHKLRIMFIPSGYYSLFDNTVYYENLYAWIGVTPLSIGENVRQAVIRDISSSGLDFATLFVVASFIAFFYGLLAFGNTENTKALSGLYGKKNAFWLLIAIRCAIVSVFCLLLIIYSGIILLLFGLNIFGPPLIAYLSVALLLTIFMFISGALFSTFKNEIKIILASAVFLFTFLIMNYDLFVSIPEEEVDHKIVEFELNQDFYEKNRADIEKIKSKKIEFTDIDKFIAGYFKDYQKIRDYEQEMKDEMGKNIRLSQYIFSLSPFTFYFSVCAELSNGEKNKISFYQKAREIKEAFLKWNLKRKIFEVTNQGKVEILIEKNSDENIFYATPSLPDGFVIGICVTLFYIFAFALFAYYRYLKYY